MNKFPKSTYTTYRKRKRRKDFHKLWKKEYKLWKSFLNITKILNKYDKNVTKM